MLARGVGLDVPPVVLALGGEGVVTPRTEETLRSEESVCSDQRGIRVFGSEIIREQIRLCGKKEAVIKGSGSFCIDVFTG